ncbi:MAG: glycosyltransferase family 1 protein [candidate division WOR-3 bacterium]
MHRMRVAFDLRWVNRDPGGVTTYAVNLLKALVQQNSHYAFLAIVNPGDQTLADRYLGEPITGIDWLTVPGSPFSPWSHLVLPRLLKARGVALFHSPNYLGPLLPGPVKIVVTVHDLMAYLFPQRCPEAKAVRWFGLFKLGLRQSLANADLILADSANTAADVRANFPSVSHRLKVVHPALNPVFFVSQPASEIERLTTQVCGAHCFLLYVGRRDPNKNLIPLIQAVGQLRKCGQEIDLVIVGRPDSRYPEPELVARRLGIAAHVHFTGFVELPVLRALYRSARALVFPSSYEGFGLPPLEAMASGTPVVCSARASLPEVVGDVAVLVEPEDPGSIAAGIQRVLYDNELRQRLIEQGLRRARLFSWAESARKVLYIYEQTLLTQRPQHATPYA